MEILYNTLNNTLILNKEDLLKDIDLRGIHFKNCYYPKGYNKQLLEFIKNHISSFGFSIKDLYTNFIQYEKRRTV